MNTVPANVRFNTNQRGDVVKDAKPKRCKRPVLTDLSNAISSTLHITSNNEDESEEFNKAPAPPIEQANSEERMSTDDEPVEQKSEKKSHENKDSEKFVDPCPEFDYDRGNSGDPFQCPEYAMDIFRYYHHRELIFRPFDYLSRHPQLKKVRRAKIVDYYVRCQEDFEVNHEVLYHAVKLFDLYMCISENTKEFEYVAAAAMIIAAKVDQQDPPIVDDFTNLTSSTKYSIVNKYERNILKAFNCDVNFPLSYRFLRRFSRVGGFDMPMLTLARFILETSLLFYEFICVPDSVMAAAALLLALRMTQAGDWSTKLVKYSGYQREHLEPLMWRLNHMMTMRKKVFPMCQSIDEKYSHGIFFEVANAALLPDKRPRNEPVGPPEGLGFETVLMY